MAPATRAGYARDFYPVLLDALDRDVADGKWVANWDRQYREHMTRLVEVAAADQDPAAAALGLALLAGAHDAIPSEPGGDHYWRQAVERYKAAAPDHAAAGLAYQVVNWFLARNKPSKLAANVLRRARTELQKAARDARTPDAVKAKAEEALERLGRLGLAN